MRAMEWGVLNLNKLKECENELVCLVVKRRKQVLLQVSELMGTCFKVREAYSVSFKEKLRRDGLKTGGERTQAKIETGQKLLRQVKDAREAGKRTVVSGRKTKRKENDNFCFFVQERLC